MAAGAGNRVALLATQIGAAKDGFSFLRISFGRDFGDELPEFFRSRRLLVECGRSVNGPLWEAAALEMAAALAESRHALYVGWSGPN